MGDVSIPPVVFCNNKHNNLSNNNNNNHSNNNNNNNNNNSHNNGLYTYWYRCCEHYRPGLLPADSQLLGDLGE